MIYDINISGSIHGVASWRIAFSPDNGVLNDKAAPRIYSIVERLISSLQELNNFTPDTD